VVLRPIGSPLPLGFLALAVGTFVLAGLQLSWIAKTQMHEVGLLLIAFVFPLQALAAIYGFLSRDPVAGTGMALLSGSWLCIGVASATGVPGRTSGALGLLLVASAACLLVPVLAAGSGKVLAAVVMAGAACRFAATGGYQLSGGHTWKVAAGIVGLVLAALAGYGGLAFEIESNRRRTVLPTGRRGLGRASFTSDFAAQVADVHHEAGVREQL
jgi:succinate-acetate transporter protein